MLAHMVYFTLKDASSAAIDKLVRSCHENLSGHDGTVFFAAGTLVEDLQRPVNVRDFHVALHVVFTNREAHDAYQTHERHLQFIEQNKENWAQVRVYDSYVE
ncbi:MAG: Dabb family protein [Pirellulaceae bacterium]